MSLPPILVVSLERSEDRRQCMEKELGRFGVDYSFFPAVDGKRLSKEEKEKLLDKRQMIARQGVILKDGEIGCALSHARVYEKMVDEKIEELLILEDDVYFDDHFFKVLSCCKEWLPSHWDIINFPHPAEYQSGNIQLEKQFSVSSLDASICLGRLKKEHFGTFCYMIRLHAARRLLELAYPIVRAADHLAGSESLHGLKIYTVYYPDHRGTLAKLFYHASTIQVDGTLKHLSYLWQSLWIAIRYKDARKKFFETRIDGVWKRVRKGYHRLLGK